MEGMRACWNPIVYVGYDNWLISWIFFLFSNDYITMLLSNEIVWEIVSCTVQTRLNRIDNTIPANLNDMHSSNIIIIVMASMKSLHTSNYYYSNKIINLFTSAGVNNLCKSLIVEKTGPWRQNDIVR